MRVAAIVVLVSALTTPSEASTSCMSKTEARQHFGSVHIYWHGPEHCWDATPARPHGVRHRVRHPEPEPMVTQRGVVMVIITIALTLSIVEILFGGTRSAGHTHRLRLGAKP